MPLGVWQFLRDNSLSNRVFTSYDDIVDHCCAAWNKHVDHLWKIMSIRLLLGTSVLTNADSYKFLIAFRVGTK
ncbi:hypothetical protein J5275_00170 [Rhizobium sp. L245/93]|nr:hypothetical protein [Rhizobium sp. L245/93]